MLMTTCFYKHRLLTTRVGYFAQSSRLLFFPGKEAISFKDVVNKKYIIKSELKCVLIMMCFRGPLIHYAFSYLEEGS